MVAIKSKTDFDDQVRKAGESLVVVDFYATWCGPCKSIAPKLTALSRKYGAKVLKVDVEKCADLAQKYKVTGMPTFVFLKNGRKVQQFAGADEERLENALKKHSGKQLKSSNSENYSDYYY